LLGREIELSNYTEELINEIFGSNVGCSLSVTHMDGKEINILVFKNTKMQNSEQDFSSVNEERAATTISHMNASLSALNSPVDLHDAQIGLELSIGVLIDFIDVYRMIVAQLSDKGIQTTFFISFGDDNVDINSFAVESVISDLVNLGADCAVDKLQTVADFERCEHIFELITKIRLNKQNFQNSEFIEMLSAKSIKAIQDIT
jgi:hypothetical protein